MKPLEIVNKFLKELRDRDCQIIGYKDNTEWLNKRKIGIGGSDVGSILGFNKYRSAIDIWLDKTSEEIKGIEPNAAMHWGTKLEPIIADEFKAKHPELQIMNVNQIISRDKSLANIDRLIWDGKNFGILEIKTTGTFSKDQWVDGEIPQSYYCQVVHYLAVTGAKFAWVAVLIGGQEYREFYIERKEEECDYIFNTCNEWWENHVVQNIPPTLDESDSYNKYLIEKILKIENDIPIEIPYLIDKVTEYKGINKEIKALDSKKKLIANEILNELVENNCKKAIVDTSKINLLSRVTNEIDYKSLNEDYPDLILADYQQVKSVSNYITIK